mgnify:CR=1 FL=1
MLKSLAPDMGAIRSDFSWRRRALLRQLLGPRVERHEWEALAAYQGLTHQAYSQRPLRPEIASDVWLHRGFRPPTGLKPFFSPAQRERENSSHHYGHDIQLKRHAGLPLVGKPLPFLLEHGLKVTREAQFEKPQHWAHCGYLCMGELRAQWLRETYGCSATAIGPWIHYAKPILTKQQLLAVRQELGKSLLVILAHSWDLMCRSMDISNCVAAIERMADEHGYQQVIWLRHWQDSPNLKLPHSWILACNGHRSNPWFLDSLHTLLNMSEGLVTNSFGTHIGYAAALGKQLHWISTTVKEDYSQLPNEQAKRAKAEHDERQRISLRLSALLDTTTNITIKNPKIMELLDPYWGFSQLRTGKEMKKLLTNIRTRQHCFS